MNIKELPTTDKLTELIDDSMEDRVVLLSEAVKNDPIKGEKFKSGFTVFDDAMAGGFQDGDLIIITGLSGEGKTTYAQTLTYNLCKQGVPCVWFSYEVTLHHLKEKFDAMRMDDFDSVYVPNKMISGNLSWIKRKIEEAKIRYNAKVIFIDHIDFIAPNNSKTSETHAAYLKNITTELKQLANELNVVIVTMAHLKKIEDGKEPGLYDIGYSAGVIQLADYVLMVIRERNKQYKSFGGDDKQGDTYTNNSIIKYVKNRKTGQLKYLKCQLINEKFVQIDNSLEADNRISEINL